MSNIGIKVSKEGEDVLKASNKDLLISSQFDTFKIFKTGEIYIDLPEETFNTGVRTKTATFNHNLGYPPVYTPMMRSHYAYDDDPNFLENGGNYIVNDIDGNPIPASEGWSPGFDYEASSVYIDSTKLTLEITRSAWVFDVKFGARRATLYYTIFYNPINEEFNLLEN